jgi:xanthine dehydrogenase accessory factor
LLIIVFCFTMKDVVIYMEVYMKNLVVIKSGGDIATGVACRLYRSGFQVVITELPQPTVVRRTVAFAQAVFTGETVVEGITAQRVEIDKVSFSLNAGYIPVVVDAAALSIKKLTPQVVVDAIIAKRNTGTTLAEAPVVIGLGPGFTAGMDVHAVVETMRGHDLGRVYYQGAAAPDTGIPGDIAGYTIERLLRAPVSGKFSGCYTIGATVSMGDIVGYVDGIAVQARVTGILRGLLQAGLTVTAGMKIGDIDPRCRQDHCFSISDKARAVAGGVLEAILCLAEENN